MKYYLSTLIAGVDHRDNRFEDVARRVMAWNEPDIGVEIAAFTHDEAYWQRVVRFMDEVTCPCTFHGPWIGVEVTSDPDSEAGAWLRTAYERVFDLAAQHHVRHVVVHYSQLSFTEEEHAQAQAHAYRNLEDLLQMADDRGVNMVIENLARQAHGKHLFTNDEYMELFTRFPNAHSIIDVGHANVNRLDVKQMLMTYGPRVTSFHLHNNDGTADQHLEIHAPQGTADVAQVVRWAKEYTPDANMVLEYEPHVTLTMPQLRAQLEEIRAL